MKCFFKEHYFKYSTPILLAVLPFLIPGCHSDRTNYSFITTSFPSPREVVLHSFTDYLQTINSPEFPLACFPSHAPQYKDPVYAEQIQRDENLQFFPAILWQIYALNRKEPWRCIAEHYSPVFFQDEQLDERPYADATRYVYLSRYLAERDQADKASLLEVLSRYISEQEASCASDTNTTDRVERLLDNHLWFFASKETGDPVYAQLAQQHSESIFEYYFQDPQFNGLYYALANCISLPDTRQLEQLQSEDFYQLAVIFYGFTILNNQQENERYHSLCVRLADLFPSLLDPKDPLAEGLLARKIDLLSKALICLALTQLDDPSENHYLEKAEKIFDQILDELSRSDEKENGPYSLKLYYYLFEFFQKSNSL